MTDSDLVQLRALGSAALCLILMAGGCATGSDNSQSSDGGVSGQITVLKSEIINSDPVIGLPYLIVLSDDRLWVMDASRNPSIHALEAQTGKLIRSYGKKGQGPGDFEAPSVLSVYDADASAIWVWDGTLRRVTRLAIPGSSDTTLKIVGLETGGPRVSRAFRLGAEMIVGFAPGEDIDRLHIFDALGRRKSVAASYVPADTSVAPRERLKAVWNVRLCSRSDGKGFAIAYPYVNRIDFYDSSARLLGSAEGSAPHEDVFPTDSLTGERRYRERRSYFVSCVATPSGVLALFDGEPPSERLHAGRTVYSYAWNGELRQTLALDTLVSAITSDDNTEWLYGVSLESGAVLRFKRRL